MLVTTLDKLVPGESGRIIKVSGRGAIRRRLMDMGLTSGAVINMVKESPLGDPVEYRLRGYHLSLRKSEAKTIEVELLGSSLPMRGRRHYSGSALTLVNCRSGEKVEITRTRGGKGLNRKLEILDLKPGCKICIIKNDFPGPLIISINDKERLVLGRGIARHVLVKPS